MPLIQQSIIDALRASAAHYPAVLPLLSPRSLWLATTAEAKTYDHFLRSLTSAVNDLYNGKITTGQFVTLLADLIPQQLTRAWNEGMRANDLDPQADMTPEWAQQLQDIILAEYDYVDGFAADIATGAKAGTPIGQYQGRAALWANRYNDTVNEAKLATADPKDRLEWVYGDTDHCTTCESLNGLVASASEWDQAGIKPQSPPNDMLECGGWRCRCTLQPTDKRRTPHALDRIVAISGQLG